MTTYTFSVERDDLKRYSFTRNFNDPTKLEINTYSIEAKSLDIIYN